MLKIKVFELLQIIMFSICGTSILLQNDKPIWMGLIMYSLVLINIVFIIISQKYRDDDE